LSFFDKIFDIIAWIKIFLSPFIIGLVLASVIWFSNDSNLIKMASLGVAGLGIILGIIFAEKIRKKTGTQEFVSRIYRTPELEKNQESK